MPARLGERMQLGAILGVLGAAAALAQRLNREVAEHIRQHDGVAEIRTEDGSVARHFRIRQGKIRSRRGTHPSPTYAMIYKDVPTALRIMKTGNEEASMTAMAQGELRFDGDLTFGMWFNELLQKTGALMKNPRGFVAR